MPSYWKWDLLNQLAGYCQTTFCISRGKEHNEAFQCVLIEHFYEWVLALVFMFFSSTYLTNLHFFHFSRMKASSLDPHCSNGFYVWLYCHLREWSLNSQFLRNSLPNFVYLLRVLPTRLMICWETITKMKISHSQPKLHCSWSSTRTS